MPESKLNHELVGRLIGAPGGVYGLELAEITPDYRVQIWTLEELGAEFEYAEDPAGKKFCKLTNPERVREIIAERAIAEEPPHSSVTDMEPQAPAPPPSQSPPAETPAAATVVVNNTAERRDPRPVHQGHFIARSIRVDARKITLTPAQKQDAQIALGFAMDVQGARIHVYMDVIEEPVQSEPKPPEKGDEMPKDPKDMRTVQTIVKPPDEKDPAKKSKQQLDKELSEQVQKGEISTTLADSTAKMAGL